MFFSWSSQKALNAVKSMMRLRRLSSLIRKEEEEKRQEEEAAEGTAADGGDSGMASPSTSEPRTPTTPRLEPLVEEETEELEEQVPASMDINHNEVMENNLSEECSSESTKKENHIQEDVVENHQSEKRMKKDLSNEKERSFDESSSGTERSVCNACLHEAVMNQTSERQVSTHQCDVVVSMACFCSEPFNDAWIGDFMEVLDSKKRTKDCLTQQLISDHVLSGKLDEFGVWAENHSFIFEKVLDPCIPIEEPVTSFMMSYSEFCEPGLGGPPTEEEHHESGEITAIHGEVNESNQIEDNHSGSWQSDSNGNCLPGVDRIDLDNSQAKTNEDTNGDIVEKCVSLDDVDKVSDPGRDNTNKRSGFLNNSADEAWLPSPVDGFLPSPEGDGELAFMGSNLDDRSLQSKGSDTSAEQGNLLQKNGVKSETSSDKTSKGKEKMPKRGQMSEKSLRRKSGVVQKPKLQGIIEKSLEGEEVELQDGEIFKSKEFQEDKTPSTKSKDTRRMSNQSILSEDSVDLSDLDFEDTHQGRSDILAFDHSRMEAKAAVRSLGEKPVMPKVMPPKMANLAQMMLKMSKEKKTTGKDSSKGNTRLFPPTSLRGMDPPSPIKKSSTSRVPFIIKRSTSLFGDETDKRLHFSRFDKYFLLLFTSKVVRFYLSLLFGLALGVIINFFAFS